MKLTFHSTERSPNLPTIEDTIEIKIKLYSNEDFSENEEYNNVEKSEIIKSNLLKIVDIINENNGDIKSIHGSDSLSEITYSHVKN